MTQIQFTTDVAVTSGVEERVRLHIAVESPCVEDNIGLAIQCAMGFVGPYVEVKDTEEYSLALMGLWDAVETFDASLGNKFSTHAAKCMKNKIIGAKRFNGRQKRNIPLVQIDDLNAEVFTAKTSASIFANEVMSDHPDDTTQDIENKAILHEHFVDGVTWEQIGQRLGITKAGARFKGQSAIKLIRDRFKE